MATQLRKNKTKAITVRIDEDMKADIDFINEQCKQHGLTWSVTDFVNTALAREISAVKKELANLPQKDDNAMASEDATHVY